MDDELAERERRERRIQVALVVLAIAIILAAAAVVAVVLSDRTTVTAPLSTVPRSAAALRPSTDRPGSVSLAQAANTVVTGQVGSR